MDLHRTSFPLSSVIRGNVEKRGWLTKWNNNGLRRGWKRRYVVLKGNHLFFFKSLKDDESVASVLNLDDYRAVWHDSNCKKSRHSFRVSPITASTDSKKPRMLLGRNREVQFFADNAEDMRVWIQCIQRKLPRADGNILDSVLRRLDYNKYARTRSDTDLRSHSSRDSMNSNNSASEVPSLSNAGSSGEETPHGSVTSTSPLSSSLSASTELAVKTSPIMERRRARRTAAVDDSLESKLERRRSSPLLPGKAGASHRRAMHLDFDRLPLPTFNATAFAVTTPTFGYTSPPPMSPIAADYDDFVVSLRTSLPEAEEYPSHDALSRMEFM